MMEQCDQCKKKFDKIPFICLHINCLKFSPLCENCKIQHQKIHADSILTRDKCKDQVEQTMIRIKEDLERYQDKAATELTTLSNSNIDETILEIESIRHQINKLFENYIQNLKDKFEQKIRQKIHKVYDEIKLNIDILKQFLRSVDSLETQKKLNQNDLEYQAKYQYSHLEDLIEQRINQKFEGKIDDDVALHFIGVIQKELEKLVVYDRKDESKKKNPFFQAQSKRSLVSHSNLMDQKNYTKKFRSYITMGDFVSSFTDLKIPSLHRNWMFYFEPNSKYLHYIDVTKPKATFQKIELDITFSLKKGARSILGDNGKIYYFCGYDEKQSLKDESEDDQRNIYQFNFEELTLKPVARMITPRNHFAVCSTAEQEIYIIGGQNHKEGCLPKCEKLNLKLNKITIINSLCEPSSMHSVVNYKNEYIFKFGGLRINIEETKEEQFCKLFLLAYSIEQDQWMIINFQQGLQLPNKTLLSGTIQLPEGIFVFGGLQNYHELTSQSYLMIVQEEEEFDTSDILTQSLTFSFQLNYSPIKQACYALGQSLQYNNNHYVMLSPDNTGYNKMIQVYSNSNKWKDL